MSLLYGALEYQLFFSTLEKKMYNDIKKSVCAIFAANHIQEHTMFSVQQ